MKCALCHHGNTKPGRVTVTLNREDTTVILKEVPAEICENCGEYYLSEEQTDFVFLKAEAAAKNGAEVEIIKYAA